MLDIIIPSYNNEIGLYNTLFSLSGLGKQCQIYIIDDNSTDNINYNMILSNFKNFFNIEFIKLDKNIGPGKVRQLGLSMSKNKYILFLDCGDQIVLPNNLLNYIDYLENNSNINIISCSHFEERNNKYNIILPINNRMHGKIYRISYLKKYNINFNCENSYANEDIAFNFLCRLIDEYYHLNSIIHIEEPLVIWTYNNNSIVNKNNGEFIYKDQNIGLAMNMHITFQHLLDLKIPYEYLIPTIYEIFCSLYNYYIETINNKPEYEKYALKGAKYFYDIYFQSKEIQPELLLQEYIKMLKNNYCSEQSIFNYKIITLNIIDFMDMLEQMEVFND